MEEFKTKTDPDGKKFLAWWENQEDEENQEYALNCKSPSEWMIHKGHCIHFAFNRMVNLSSTRKICSPDRRELEAIAKKETGHLPRECQTCMKD